MPEGPEVLRCGIQLASIIKGKFLRQFKPLTGKLSRRLKTIDINQKVDDVVVKGKTIFIQLASGEEIVSTLGMSGWWYPSIDKVGDMKVYHQQKLIEASDVVLKSLKHSRVELVIDDSSAFYVDQRNFGNMKIVSKSSADDIRCRIGVEMLPIGKDIDGYSALKALRTQDKREIGAVLLNQDILSGIGNIYRAEILYLCKINPFRTVSTLSDDELKNLIEVAATVLKIAFLYEGTLLYPIEFLSRQFKLLKLSVNHICGPLAYQRSADIFGNPIEKFTLAGRTMWWVPAIQK